MNSNRRSAEVAKGLPKEYYVNYYGEGIELSSENAFWNAERFMEGIKDFIEFRPRETSFLDMGAGQGAIVKLMRDYGLKADGYELNPYALGKAEVKLIERDVTKPFLKKYDIAYSNVFMYFSEYDFDAFFKNNRDKFKVLVMVYPFDGNDDVHRTNMKDREFFKTKGKEYGLLWFEEEEGLAVLIKEEDVHDLPFR